MIHSRNQFAYTCTIIENISKNCTHKYALNFVISLLKIREMKEKKGFCRTVQEFLYLVCTSRFKQSHHDFAPLIVSHIGEME